jgi:hypothetical protein
LTTPSGVAQNRVLAEWARDCVRVDADRIEITDRFAVTLQRTLRIPDDGREYPLPPGLGRFPVYAVDDFRDRVPASWADGDLFIPMYQREALWLGLDSAPWKPTAVKVGVGNTNAVSGETWDLALSRAAQDYVVCPPQLWLDGINSGDESIRQFVAMPLGSGVTIEGQLTGRETVGGIQLVVFDPKPGRFPDQPPPPSATMGGMPMAMPMAPDAEMGLGAGGQMRQRIYPDPHGLDTWNEQPTASVAVHILNSELFRQVTGFDPPPTPIDVQTYIEWKLPWFELYDADRGSIPASDRLRKVKSIEAFDAGEDAPE